MDVEQYLDNLDTVIFDLDDTLYAEKDYVRSGFLSVAKEFPQIKNMAERLWNVFESGGRAFDTVLAEEKITDKETKLQVLQVYRFHIPKITLYDGVADMLMRIRQRGIRLGIITDGRPEGQRAKIEALGLETLVDHVIITDELGGTSFRKPCDLAFKKMQEHMQVPFERMMYIGDNVIKDFVAPEHLGMKSCHVIPPDGLYCNNQASTNKQRGNI